jgi:hypothetical protein
MTGFASWANAGPASTRESTAAEINFFMVLGPEFLCRKVELKPDFAAHNRSKPFRSTTLLGANYTPLPGAAAANPLLSASAEAE